MKKILLIDRDGTLIKEPQDQQIDHFEKLEFLDGVISNLSKIKKELDYELIMITNQDGLGTASFPEKKFWNIHNKILSILKSENIVFSDVLIDRSFEHENLPTRKPGIGMLNKYIYGQYDLKNSFVIGDRITDIQLAKNIGAQSIHISNDNSEIKTATLKVNSWFEIYQFLKKKSRKAIINRKTNETNIKIDLNLDGTGKSEIITGLGFFDHMLEQIAKHGSLDLIIKVQGDLNVDEHHSIEDTAISLGLVFFNALKNKKGIERYGFCILPMEDSLAQVAIDFGGRSWIEWNIKFKHKKINEIPTEMFYHFFKSFSDNSKCNLHIKTTGKNDHHKIEATFKAFAKAIKNAVAQTYSETNIPSTKGII